ncbi:MAG TPA: MFS transporter [Lacunisphaera sp.]|nr:MFS transporter [Lacunisphaera sp.]
MKLPHLRWWIVGLLFLASILNYLDRQTLSILAPTIQQELALSDDDYALVVNCFLVAYTVATLVSGRVVDYLGVRVSLALFVGWWSVANILTGFARSLGSLGFFRFMLGLGEAGNWTAAPKAVAAWFAPRERGMAIGLYTLGATIGATIAPLLITAVAARHGWQGAFVITGLLGLVWLVPWLCFYRAPREHPLLRERERALLPVEPPVVEKPEGWLAVLRRREVWLLMLGRMLTDPVWYFYQFWFAKYLHDERGVSQLGLSITFVIFLAADLGSVGGGWFSGLLVKRGHTAPAARLRIMLLAACLMPLSAVVPLAGWLWLALAAGMLIAFAHMAWLINLSSLVVDLVPQRSLATAFGVIATGSALGGMMMNSAVGKIVSQGSYAPAFVALAFVHPLAIVILWRLRRPSATWAASLSPTPFAHDAS